MTETVESELKKQGFTKERIELKVYLNMRYHGTDSPLMVIRPDKLKVEETDEGEDWGVAFAKAYKVISCFCFYSTRVGNFESWTFPSFHFLAIGWIWI